MKLLKNDDAIIRVLMEQFEKSLIIDCIKRTMPKWVLSASLAEFWECAESELYERTGLPQNRELSEEDKVTIDENTQGRIALGFSIHKNRFINNSPIYWTYNLYNVIWTIELNIYKKY